MREDKTDKYLAALKLVDKGMTVKKACAKLKLAPSTYYKLNKTPARPAPEQIDAALAETENKGSAKLKEINEQTITNRLVSLELNNRRLGEEVLRLKSIILKLIDFDQNLFSKPY